MKQTRLCVLVVAVLSVCVVSPAQAAAPSPLMTVYPLLGSPYHVAVEQPGRIWATLRAQDAITRLVVTSPDVFEVSTFQLPTAPSEPSSEPYDIAYAAGAVWVTEYAGNKIARFDPVAETWTEYPIPTADSAPTGLVVLPGNPVEVWFCEQAGDKLGRLRVSGDGSGVFDEFPLPWSGAGMESIDALSSEGVWFTAPGRSIFGRFRLSKWQPPQPGSPDPGGAFYAAFTGAGSKPYEIKLGADGMPWFTEPGNNRIGHWAPGTLILIEWIPVPTAASDPMGIDIAAGYVWFTERAGDRLGRLRIVDFVPQLNEFLLPGVHPAPTDVAVDPTGCVWSAASGTDQMISWCPHFAYLPLIRRDQ